MNIKTNILIFSVFQTNTSRELNESRHRDVLARLQRSGVPAIELQGKYNGNEELSILVDGFNHRADVEYFCREFNQECYLESHNDRATSLVFPDGTRQKLGTLVAASKDEAEASGSYPYNPNSGYFIVRQGA
jgi:hypothetical protein